MNIRATLLSLAAALGAVSCGGTTAPPGQSSNPAISREDATPAPDRSLSQKTGQTGAKNAAPGNDEDVPPAGARYTLFCDAIRGPDHVIRAAQLKSQLIATTHSHAWHLIHTDDSSTLFYGYYRTFDDAKTDPKEFARAQGDHHWVTEMKNPQGDPMFKAAMFLPINNPDPAAPPQWNLTNTPPTAFWSLQVAAYRGAPERKQFAVDAVREMRAHGIEAYYYHGETISSVCIGTWPIEAVQKQESADARTHTSSGIPLVTNVPLPGKLNGEVRDREGNTLEVQAPKLEILDPTLKAATIKYPTHALNGVEYSKRAKDGTLIPDPSFLVQIPHPEGTVSNAGTDNFREGTAISGADQAARDILDNPTSPAPGRGRLRSIDGR